MSDIERYVFFKISYRLEDIPVGLLKIRRAYVFFKMAVIFVKSTVTFGYVFSCPCVLLVERKKFFQKVDGYSPVFFVLVVVVEFLKENGCFVVAKSFCHLTLYKLEKVDFFGNQFHKL